MAKTADIVQTMRAMIVIMIIYIGLTTLPSLILLNCGVGQHQCL